MITIAVSKARTKLPDLIDKVDKLWQRFIITKKGEAKAVLMSAEEFDSWEETLFSMSHSYDEIKKGEKEVKEKRLFSYEQVVGRRQPNR